MDRSDVAVIGAGIVGLATARELALRHRVGVLVLESEPRVAAHQTGHNSGVLHSGLYYKPGSRKARNCAEGRRALLGYCESRGIPLTVCGKVVVATTPAQLGRLDELERRGNANGLSGVRRIGPEESRELEPHVGGMGGLHVPETGVVDFGAVAEALAQDIRGAGGALLTGARLRSVERRQGGGFLLRSAAGEHETRAIVACAGLHADRVARACGLRPEVRIVPFRGEYWKLRPGRDGLVRHLIYPVPDPRFPFLGVHFTRRIDGTVEVGPNAILALARHGYRRTTISARDLLDMLGYPGFWRLVGRYGATGLAELRRSLSRPALARELGRLVPAIESADLERAGAGVRAQAVGRDGALLDDFHVVEAERMLHVINAPSPAATASLAIGAALARRAQEIGIAA